MEVTGVNETGLLVIHDLNFPAAQRPIHDNNEEAQVDDGLGGLGGCSPGVRPLRRGVQVARPLFRRGLRLLDGRLPRRRRHRLPGAQQGRVPADPRRRQGKFGAEIWFCAQWMSLHVREKCVLRYGLTFAYSDYHCKLHYIS